MSGVLYSDTDNVNSNEDISANYTFSVFYFNYKHGSFITSLHINIFSQMPIVYCPLREFVWCHLYESVVWRKEFGVFQ